MAAHLQYSVFNVVMGVISVSSFWFYCSFIFCNFLEMKKIELFCDE